MISLVCHGPSYTGNGPWQGHASRSWQTLPTIAVCERKKTALRHVVLPWVAASTILIAPLFALG